MQNIINLVRTRKYEVPFNSEVGINPSYIDSSIYIAKAEIIAEVTDMINEYEPNASVRNIDIAGADANGNAVFLIEVEV